MEKNKSKHTKKVKGINILRDLSLLEVEGD